MKSDLQAYLLAAEHTQQFIKVKQQRDAEKKGLSAVLLHLPNGSKTTSTAAAASHAIDVLSTVKNYLVTDKLTVNYKPINNRSAVCILFLIDSSGSMVQHKQIAYIKGMIQQTIEKYRYKKISYAAIALCNNSAQLISPLTIKSNEMLCAIAALPTTGKTAMKAGFKLVNQLLNHNGKEKNLQQLYIFTDGKINAGDGPNPFQDAVDYHKTNLKAIVHTTIVDTENGFVKLKLAKKLARETGANYISIFN